MAEHLDYDRLLRALGLRRKGPRTIDLDILLYGDSIIRERGLIIPHPRMHQRSFVLKPICDIDPDIFHPVLKKNVNYLLKQINRDGKQVIKV